MSDAERAPSMRIQAIRSMKWSAGSRIGIQLLQFGTQIALARILTPREFGVAAVALVVSNFALLISDLGIGASLIHGADLTRQRKDTAFWINALLGVVIAAAVMVASRPVSLVLGQPAAAGPLVVAGLTCALAVNVVPLAILERSLNMRPVAIIEMAGTVAGSVCGVCGALAGFGVYAILAVPLVSTFLGSVLYLVATKYVPRSFIDRVEAVSIIHYVRGLVGFSVINFFTRNTDTLLLARTSGAGEIGFYSRAFSLMLLPVSQVQVVIGRVLFPALSRLRGDLPRLRAAHRRTLVLASAICAPLSVGAAATSHDLVLTLFGAAWLPMVPMLAILSVTGVQQVFQGTVGALFQATGRTGLMFQWNLLFTAITIIAFLIGIRWGAIGLCWAVFLRGWLLLPITLLVPLHLIGERLRTVFRLLVPLTICLVIEGVAVLFTGVAMGTVVSTSWIRLIVEIAVGVIAYIVALRLLQPDLIRELRRAIRPTAGVAT